MLLFTVVIYNDVEIIQQVSLMNRYSWYLQGKFIRFHC